MTQNPALLDSQAQIDKYLDGVTIKARHHAHNVQDVIPLVAVSLFSLYPTSVTALTRNGDLKNAVWVQGNNTKQRYAITYNHNDECIDVRLRSLHGPVMYTFTNSTTVSEIITTISSL